MINKLSKKIIEKYKKYFHKKECRACITTTEKELSMLSPGVDYHILAEDYYTKKIGNSIIVVCASVIILVFSIISRIGSNVIDENNRVARKNYGEGKINLFLQAQSDEYDYGNINIEVEERRLTKKEYAEKISEITGIIDTIILGENEDMRHIDSNMELPVNIEGFPFTIRWESSDYMLIHTDGCLGDIEADENGEDVCLKAIITYGEVEYEKYYDIRVFPKKLTEEQKHMKEVMDALAIENKDTIETEYMKLPERINGTPIRWSEVKEPFFLIIFLGMILTILALWIGADKDLKGKCDERNRKLLIEYSEFVSKLQLLLSSGLTIRGALERMAGDYKKNRKKGGDKKYVYEELLICTKKLQDGMSEANCYEFFGNRCGLINYKKLASLLVQNLRKGNEGLIVALANESEAAFEERKADAKRLGEEAQTKLLFPMIIMLAIVMIIIMIPAYLSFGSM